MTIKDFPINPKSIVTFDDVLYWARVCGSDYIGYDYRQVIDVLHWIIVTGRISGIGYRYLKNLTSKQTINLVNKTVKAMAGGYMTTDTEIKDYLLNTIYTRIEYAN